MKSEVINVKNAGKYMKVQVDINWRIKFAVRKTDYETDKY